MNAQTYKKQVLLLLEVLPHIAREERFAMHGGTAINLFARDMPRISVDIDLTYLPIEDRQTSLLNIRDALQRISERIVATSVTEDLQKTTNVAIFQLPSSFVTTLFASGFAEATAVWFNAPEA